MDNTKPGGTKWLQNQNMLKVCKQSRKCIVKTKEIIRCWKGLIRAIFLVVLTRPLTL